MILELEYWGSFFGRFAPDQIGNPLTQRAVRSSRKPADRRAICRSKAARDPLAARLEADYGLAQRCVRGDVAAWSEIYAQHHDRLCRSIRIMLGSLPDANLVDEIAAHVWYALVADDGKLLARYTPARKASLITFMRALARDKIKCYVRSEVRRRQREAAALWQNSAGRDHAHEAISASINDFLATLTPLEQKFCREFLLQPRGDGLIEGFGPTHVSSANVWQQTRRLYLKMLEFLRSKK